MAQLLAARPPVLPATGASDLAHQADHQLQNPKGTHLKRIYPIGAECINDGVDFRVWAPKSDRVTLLIEGREGEPSRHPMTVDESDREYHHVFVRGACAGTRYQLELSDGRGHPDPASRFQPRGPDGPSEVVDWRAFAWPPAEAAWPGVRLRGTVLYELHVGTFTAEGTWAAARQRLPYLRQLGVTVVELMPVNEFAGDFGWGYDGVALFAPYRRYGTPDELRAFVAAAHALGLGVLMDVVYNHLGPEGNHLLSFGPYLCAGTATEWGDSMALETPAVREYVISNAVHWLREYHLDGLRLDATQALHDSAPPPRHVIAQLAAACRAAAAPRSVLLVGENEPQNCALLRPPFGLDALVNDDLHHSCRVAATGRPEAYLSNHRGTAQELISAARWGFLYQGQLYVWQAQARGQPTRGLAPEAFVACLQNHDQVPNNTALGKRLHQLTSPPLMRAITAYALLIPATPMLFQGQEWAASSPFRYFADHGGELAQLVATGRADFVKQFSSIRAFEQAGAPLPLPHARETFEACKLRWEEQGAAEHAASLALHRHLLQLRRTDAVLARQAGPPLLEGAVLGPRNDALLLRFLAEDEAALAQQGERLLLLNLGADLMLTAPAEPLLAPPTGSSWRMVWSSEAPVYGGCGCPPPQVLPADATRDRPAGWLLPAHSCLLLSSHPTSPEPLS